MTISMQIILGLLIFVGLFLVFRNNLIYRINNRAIDFIFTQPNWRELHKVLKTSYYFDQFVALNKWSYRQFYPQLAELEEKWRTK